MDTLKRLIYHEKQEAGSMLCAQHALNALLQGPYFTSADLGSLAQSLDDLELEYRDQDESMISNESTNMDDTGFFSVQVLDKALRVWGLSLVRWRSEELNAYHDDPDTQEAFILNLHSHWFTIRRFGMPGGNSHWFNLNSSFDAPERVGKTYLGMVLEQAENEGYSVFAIRPLEGSNAEVPVCEADEVAATIPEADFSAEAGHAGTANIGGGFEDEDMELQRALQASLMDTDLPDFENTTTPPRPPAVSQSSAFAESARRGFDASPQNENERIRASMLRGQALLQQAQEDQRRALAETFAQGGSRPRSGAAGVSTGQEEEEEMMRRAIEESLRQSGSGSGEAATGAVVEPDDDADAYFDLDDDDENEDWVQSRPKPQSQLQPQPRSAIPANTVPLPPSRQPTLAVPRVLDDEDAELQAALRASMEGLPDGFQIPETPPPRPLVHTSNPVRSVQPPPAPNFDQEDDDDDDEDGEMADKTVEVSSPVQEELSVDEIRRRRLARFGA